MNANTVCVKTLRKVYHVLGVFLIVENIYKENVSQNCIYFFFQVVVNQETIFFGKNFVSVT